MAPVGSSLFPRKRGTEYHIDLRSKRLAAIVRRCQELPGQELFQYLDEDGEARTIASQDVNDYLRDVTGEDITAKDFRTWAATNLAALALRELSEFDTQTSAKKHVLQAVGGRQDAGQHADDLPQMLYPSSHLRRLPGRLAEAAD